MKRLGSMVLALVCAAAAPGVRAELATNAPVFSEVYELVRTHVRGLSQTDLNRAAVDGLIQALHPRLSLVTNGAPPAAAPTLLSQARVIEDNVACFRVRTVAEGLAPALAETHRALSRTGSVVGVVLDLRYADGNDYAAIGPVVGLFAKAETALLDLGGEVVKAKPAAEPVALPVAVLVNHETTGAAEALAAALRLAGAGLLLGGETAGVAAAKEDFTLSTGQKLRIAAAPVKLADGTPLSPRGVKPDITVQVSEADERAFFTDPYRESPKLAEVVSAGPRGAGTTSPASTNRTARRPRPNEADLVRARREGVPLDADFVTAREPEPARPVLRDPALARAVDLLKALAVVRKPRP